MRIFNPPGLFSSNIQKEAFVYRSLDNFGNLYFISRVPFILRRPGKRHVGIFLTCHLPGMRPGK